MNPKSIFLVLLFLVTGCNQEAPQTADAEVIDTSQAEALVAQKVSDWASAEMQRNESWLQENIDERFILISRNGKLMNKTEYIRDLMDTESESENYASQVRVQVFNGFASSQYVYDSKGQRDEVAWENHLNCMDLWVLEDGEWRVLRAQCTTIEE